jgi:hypothetical protein
VDDCCKCQTSTATPAEPGDLHWRLVGVPTTLKISRALSLSTSLRACSTVLGVDAYENEPTYARFSEATECAGMIRCDAYGDTRQSAIPADLHELLPLHRGPRRNSPPQSSDTSGIASFPDGSTSVDNFTTTVDYTKGSGPTVTYHNITFGDGSTLFLKLVGTTTAEGPRSTFWEHNNSHRWQGPFRWGKR